MENRREEKKSGIFLLVILPILVGGGFAIVAGLTDVFADMRGIQAKSLPNLNMILICLPAIFLWLPVSLLLSNCVMYVVPPLRQIAETYASDADRPDFAESQRMIGKVTFYMLLVCGPLIALGFFL